METRKFKDLTIRDAFMFAAVMSDPEICRRVLELALGIPISEVHIQTEKTMAYHSEYHGVRLDVYAADADRTRFNVEMQVTLQKLSVILIHSVMDCIVIQQVWSVKKRENL